MSAPFPAPDDVKDKWLALGGNLTTNVPMLCMDGKVSCEMCNCNGCHTGAHMHSPSVRFQLHWRTSASSFTSGILSAQVYTQSSAVLRHAARKGGLMPANEELQYQATLRVACIADPDAWSQHGWCPVYQPASLTVTDGGRWTTSLPQWTTTALEPTPRSLLSWVGATKATVLANRKAVLVSSLGVPVAAMMTAHAVS